MFWKRLRWKRKVRSEVDEIEFNQTMEVGGVHISKGISEVSLTRFDLADVRSCPKFTYMKLELDDKNLMKELTEPGEDIEVILTLRSTRKKRLKVVDDLPQ